MTKAELINILKKNEYEKELIDYILSKNIKRILGRKIDELEKVIKLLKQENIDVRKCLTILARGKSDEIEKIIKLLKQENIDVKNCLSVLAQGKSDEIKKIIKLLKQENIDIKNCLTILARGKSDEIEKIIKLLKQEYIDVRKCLTILAQGKSDEIEKIIKLLKQEHIDVRKCLTILAKGKSDEIEKTIKLLKQENISVNKIVEFNMYYLLYEKYENVENLVMFKNSYHNDDEIKKYFKLKYTTNKFYSKKEIKEICHKLNIDISKFLDIFKIKNKSLKEEIIKNLNNDKQLWIGNSYQCTKEQLENNKEFILKMCHIVSINFAKKYNCIHLINDLEGCVLDIIIDKCGDFFYEYEDKNLFYSIYSYCIKSLHNFINKNTLQLIDNKKYNSDINYEEYNSKVLQDMNLDITEREIIDYLSYLLENGVANYEENIKNKYNLNNDEYSEIIEKVKIKIINSKNNKF